MMLLVSGELRRADETYLRLLARYLRLEEFHGVRVVEVGAGLAEGLGVAVLPALLRPGEPALHSIASITEALVEAVNFHVLLGGSDSDRGSCLRYLELNGPDCPPLADIAEKVNAELVGQSFLDKNAHVHVSDLFVLVLLTPYIAKLSTVEKLRLSALYRWSRYLQSLDGIKQNIAAVGLTKIEKVTIDSECF